MTWRPFEPSKEAVEEAARTVKREIRFQKMCMLHSDCQAADEMIRAAGGRRTKFGAVVMTDVHCYDETCDKCFGHISY